MAAGQVSFKDQRKVKRILVPTRENAIVNRLNKTKVEKHPDLMQEREDMLKEARRKDMVSVQTRVSANRCAGKVGGVMRLLSLPFHVFNRWTPFG